MRLATALVLVSVISAPARGDNYVTVTPSSYLGAESLMMEGGYGGTTYLPSSGTTIGYGQAPIQIHDLVSYVNFNLSGIQGTIVGLQLTGSVTGLGPLIPGEGYSQYASLDASVILPASGDLSTPQGIFNALAGGQSLGGFTVDNGLGSSFAPNIGPNFSVSLGPSAIAAAQSGALAIGFVPVSATPFNPGVQGYLSVQLTVDVVPEPTSLCLTGLGLTVFGLVRVAGVRPRRSPRVRP